MVEGPKLMRFWRFLGKYSFAGKKTDSSRIWLQYLAIRQATQIHLPNILSLSFSLSFGEGPGEASILYKPQSKLPKSFSRLLQRYYPGQK